MNSLLKFLMGLMSWVRARSVVSLCFVCIVKIINRNALLYFHQKWDFYFEINKLTSYARTCYSRRRELHVNRFNKQLGCCCARRIGPLEPIQRALQRISVVVWIEWHRRQVQRGLGVTFEAIALTLCQAHIVQTYWEKSHLWYLAILLEQTPHYKSQGRRMW